MTGPFLAEQMTVSLIGPGASLGSIFAQQTSYLAWNGKHQNLVGH